MAATDLVPVFPVVRSSGPRETEGFLPLFVWLVSLDYLGSIDRSVSEEKTNLPTQTAWRLKSRW